MASPTAAAVRASLAYYTGTDQANAEALDRTYPQVTGDDARPGTVPVRPGVAQFHDTAEPQSRFKPPPDYNGAYPHDPRWFDMVSPGALLRDAIWTVTGAAASLGICDRAYDRTR